jgi:hypothetical protein
LYGIPLASLAGLDALEGLERLQIDGCKQFGDLEPIAKCNRLEFLSVANAGSIPSLAPIRRLSNLKHVSFVESTQIEDGDLSMLLELPSLEKVSFQNRRHYSHTREQIWSLLNG